MIENEKTTQEGYVKREQVSAQMETLIPFLDTKIDEKHLVLIAELYDSGGEIIGHDFRQLSKRAGVYTGFDGKLNDLLSAGLIAKNNNNRFILTEIGKKVASIAPRFITGDY